MYSSFQLFAVTPTHLQIYAVRSIILCSIHVDMTFLLYILRTSHVRTSNFLVLLDSSSSTAIV